MFGGEQFSYSFNDLWSLDLVTETWQSVALGSLVSPPPRFDHSAVVMQVEGESTCWVVYGSRSGHVCFSVTCGSSTSRRTRGGSCRRRARSSRGCASLTRRQWRRTNTRTSLNTTGGGYAA